MAIRIAFPPSGTATRPTRLPRKFIAFGKKDRADVPVGVLLSIDDTTHKPDGKIVIGGTSVPYKRKNGAALEPHPERWALYFRLAGVRPAQRFSLFVFDAMALPPIGMSGKTEVDIIRRDYLAVQRRDQKIDDKKDKKDDKKDEKAPILGIKSINPASGEHVYGDQFVVYGDLPAGDYDIADHTGFWGAAIRRRQPAREAETRRF